jgi:hypothetical protein
MGNPIRAGLDPTEAAKRERRLSRYIQQGMPRSQLHKLGYKDKEINELTSRSGLTVTKGIGGKRL